MPLPLDDVPGALRAAREDVGMTQRDLAQAAGVEEELIADLEAGRRTVDAELLPVLLAATDYRPSLDLAERRESLLALAERRGLSEVRVFGSVARGSGHHDSDIDLLVRRGSDSDPLSYALFLTEATELLGFSVDVVVEGPATPLLNRETAVSL